MPCEHSAPFRYDPRLGQSIRPQPPASLVWATQKRPNKEPVISPGEWPRVAAFSTDHNRPAARRDAHVLTISARGGQHTRFVRTISARGGQHTRFVWSVVGKWQTSAVKYPAVRQCRAVSRRSGLLSLYPSPLRPLSASIPILTALTTGCSLFTGPPRQYPMVRPLCSEAGSGHQRAAVRCYLSPPPPPSGLSQIPIHQDAATRKTGRRRASPVADRIAWVLTCAVGGRRSVPGPQSH